MRGVINQIQPAVKAGLIGAAGGLGLSVGLGYLLDKLPVQLQSGYGLTAVKVVGALGVGILGGMVLKGKGNALAQGAMTVVVYDELKKIIMAQFPAVPLGEYMSMAPVVGYDEAAALEMDGEAKRKTWASIFRVRAIMRPTRMNRSTTDAILCAFILRR